MRALFAAVRSPIHLYRCKQPGTTTSDRAATAQLHERTVGCDVPEECEQSKEDVDGFYTTSTTVT
eukprot:3459944-Rhodomonas_salina.1